MAGEFRDPWNQILITSFFISHFWPALAVSVILFSIHFHGQPKKGF